MAVVEQSRTGSSIGGLLFVGLLLGNMWMGWRAWRRTEVNSRFRRSPAWGLLSAGILAMVPGTLLSRGNAELEGARLVGYIVSVPLAIIGFVVMVIGIIGLIKPFRWLEATAGSKRSKRRLTKTG